MSSTAEALRWQDDALCAKSTVDHWNSGDHAIATAKEICHRCPVREQCLEYAMGNAGLRGVWGGASERQRRRMRMERRNQPRSTP